MTEELVFFTPLLPFPSGSGSAMRAAVALEILAEKHSVVVVNTLQWGWRKGIFDRKWVEQRAAYLEIAPQADAAALESVFRNRRLAGVYVYRLAAAPLALRVLALHPARAVLDLDDDECARAERFLALRELGGDREIAARTRAEIPQLRTLRRLLLPRFDKIFLASEADRRTLAEQFPRHKFAHLPNVIHTPEHPPCSNPEPGRLLFIGTLDYFPNEDAILYFAESILPWIPNAAVRPTVRVVGPGAPDRVRALAIDIAGQVSDLAPEYARAAAVIVPLRAASGTRIKILEAFAFGRPVVSTSIGAEGLNVTDGEHLLIADDPSAFAQACERLLRDPALGERLAANAFAWLRENHSLAQARAALHAAFEREDQR